MSANYNPATPSSSGSMTTPCYCSALRQATRRVTQFYDRALAPVGLRVTQLPILGALAERGGMTMKALAAILVMDRATLGHNLRPLEAQGLVQLDVGSADKRSRRVTLTEAGKLRLAEARSVWRVAQGQFEAAFGADDADALRAMLSRAAHTAFGEQATA